MYQLKTSRKNFFDKTPIKVLVFIFLLFFLFYFSKPIKSFVSVVFFPFIKSGNFIYTNISKIPKFFYEKNSLIKENKDLYSKIENLYQNIYDYETLKYENEKLRQSLKLKPTGNFSSSFVLAKPPQIPLDSLLLDKGSEDGVREGDLIFSSEKILIGKIARISRKNSIVSLNSMAGLTSFGFVARTNEPVEIKGSGGGGIESIVPSDFDIQIGDRIIMQSYSNYLLGIVRSIEDNSVSGFKNILISLPTNIAKIDIVFIESKSND